MQINSNILRKDMQYASFFLFEPLLHYYVDQQKSSLPIKKAIIFQ